jgi:hypothetical protein
MSSLLELHQNYKALYPQYHDPLASYSPDDPNLDEIKRSALLPYLQELEEKMIIFKNIISVFAVLYDVVADEFGFSAEVWRLQPIHIPLHTEHLSEQNKWVIGGEWKQIRLLQDRINCMPWGWTFWPEDRVVKPVEEKFMNGGCLAAQDALKNSVNL